MTMSLSLYDLQFEFVVLIIKSIIIILMNIVMILRVCMK